jgi:hypothetical protein
MMYGQDFNPCGDAKHVNEPCPKLQCQNCQEGLAMFSSSYTKIVSQHKMNLIILQHIFKTNYFGQGKQ